MANEIAALKSELRPKLRFRREQFVARIDDFARAIAFRAPPGPLRRLLVDADCLGAYAATGSEAPTDGLVAVAGEAGVRTALPWFANRVAAMKFVPWTLGMPTVAGPWQVHQPAANEPAVTPDLLLCPLLGFDRKGGRIGQGGGHYDRYFADHPAALRIGIGWSVQEVDAIPREEHDFSLDAILTEQEWIVTGDRM